MDSFSAGQKQLAKSLIETYVCRLRDGHADAWMKQVDQHLDETYFAWIGGFSNDDVFYYRVHSPVILIEFDHLKGIALENDGVRFLVSPDAVRKVWHKILTDAVKNDLTARRINKADDVRNYINDGLKHQLPTAGDRLSAPINPAVRGGAAETAVPKTGAKAEPTR